MIITLINIIIMITVILIIIIINIMIIIPIVFAVRYYFGLLFRGPTVAVVYDQLGLFQAISFDGR